jgi:hypothetical protein
MTQQYLTQADADHFGYDLLDVTKRAALEVVAPHLQTLEQQNTKLRQQVAREQRRRLDEQVESAVPDFREIDRNPRWHRWLLGIDTLSGRVRQTLLNEAVASGNSNRVREFFERFRREEGGSTSQTYSPTTNRQARSYSGKPTYTRTQIGQLYEQHRKGAWTGREDEWARLEADFFAAQREGRVAGGPYLTK